MQTIVLLSVAGAAGTLARYGLAVLVTRSLGDKFPWGIWIINALGCLLYGVVVGLADHSKQISPETKLILLTGFMGAFTTFSTFAFDTHQQLLAGHTVLALVHVAGQVVSGVLLVALGLMLAKAF
jgi:CrcB protein